MTLFDDVMGLTPFGQIVGQSVGGTAADAPYEDDVQAITAYIEAQRVHIPSTPGLAEAIAGYETWLGATSWYDRNVGTSTYMANAKWHRDQINALLGEALPPDWVPADAARAAMTPATRPGTSVRVLGIPIPAATAVGGALAAGVLAVGLVTYIKIGRKS